MQVCNRYCQSSVPRDVKAKREAQTAIKRREGESILYSIPPPPPLLLLKLPWRESALIRTNGYSIAEILLVFGIIAGVLIGVWAMYTMLGDKSDAQTAIAEIQMLKKAAHEYKYAPGKQNKYDGATMASLKPYLGQSGLANGQNIFGTAVTFIPGNNNRDLDVVYYGVRDLDICRQILNQFGQVEDVEEERNSQNKVTQNADTYIEAGNTVSGFVGGTNGSTTGCQPQGGTYRLNIRID